MICFNAVEMFNASNCVVCVGLVATVVLLVTAFICGRSDRGNLVETAFPLCVAATLIFAVTAISSTALQCHIITCNLKIAEMRHVK